MPDTYQFQDLLRDLGTPDVLAQDCLGAFSLRRSNILAQTETLIHPDSWLRSGLEVRQFFDDGLGTYTHALLAPDGVSPGLSQDVEVEPGSTYTASFLARTDQPSGQELRYAVLDLINSTVVIPPTRYEQDLKTDWTRIKFSFKAPLACTRIRLYLISDFTPFLELQEGDDWIEVTALAPAYFVDSVEVLQITEGGTYYLNIAEWVEPSQQT